MASMKVFCLVLSVASTGVMVSAASLTPVNVVREGDVFAATWEVPPEYVPPNNLTRAFRITVYDKNSTVSDYCERDAVVKETCYGRFVGRAALEFKATVNNKVIVVFELQTVTKGDEGVYVCKVNPQEYIKPAMGQMALEVIRNGTADMRTVPALWLLATLGALSVLLST